MMGKLGEKIGRKRVKRGKKSVTLLLRCYTFEKKLVVKIGKKQKSVTVKCNNVTLFKKSVTASNAQLPRAHGVSVTMLQ